MLFIRIYAWSQNQYISYPPSYSENSTYLFQKGGKYITSSGDLKVLVVFAKFKDDMTPHQYWPVDSYPSEMKNFIDSSKDVGSTHFLNLTNYYKQMSSGKISVTGKAIGAVTPYPKNHYIQNNQQYPDWSLATTDLLKAIDDSVDYKQFDNWTYINDYNIINVPDGIVDMIVVIWRGLVFTDQWNGQCCLGGGSQFIVENNQELIKKSYGGSSTYGIDGSGVTIQYWGDRSRERNFKCCIHEVAHWLIHIEHPYCYYLHTFWGMLTLAGEGICANSFERELLGWLSPISIDSTMLRAQMTDFITTASAYKYHSANGLSDEYYYFENHQKLSIYDDATSNSNDKGIFISQFSNNDYNGDCVRVLTSDGFWDWEIPLQHDCWGNNLPVFRKKSVNRNGFGNRDKIIMANSNYGFIYSYFNEKDVVECNDWLHGFGFANSFDTSFNNVFSPWSNPPATTYNGQLINFAMEVNQQIGQVFIVSFKVQNALEAKPSKPPLGKDPRVLGDLDEPDIIKLAWGSDYWDGLPVESDINFSELQIKSETGIWQTIYSGENRFWNDNNYIYRSEGVLKVSFRARVRDTQDQWSIWSNIYETKKTINNTTLNEEKYLNQSLSFYLEQNYPNPFNNSTKIIWQLPVGSQVTLEVYDMLGREVATLVNEYRQAGKYETEFNTETLPSGVYLYQLRTDNYVEIKKMILVK